ncbi:hypothetical protein [Nitrosomonas ureae]|uniref:hypothetical protein n=2 Tax=Nitrosomonas TaxID=914 RepID=UPI000BB6825F|nr:hypothetical protein [Nitrosomonas ureae]
MKTSFYLLNNHLKNKEVIMQKMSPTPKRPQGIERISEAVSNLLPPPLAPLHQTFIEQKAGINEKRAELLRKRENVRNEGYAAATRLMTPSAEQLQTIGVSYLELFNKQRSSKDETR